jgi:hypothetical protein
VSAVQDVVKPLEEHFDFPYFLAKRSRIRKERRAFSPSNVETPIETPPTARRTGSLI